MYQSRYSSILIPLGLFIITLAVRIKPFVYADHFFLIPIDFDEGVYYGASVLMTKGLFPYLHYDFGHPPGIAALFSLWHWLSPLSSVAKNFALAKILVAILGSLTTLGIYHLGRKWNGTAAGVIAGLLYATYPEAIVSERSIFLEPFINGTAVLALCLVSFTRKHWILIGTLLAFAVSVKATAVIWIPPFAYLAWESGRLQNILKLVGGGIIGFIIFLLPWILLHPQNFWMDVVQFQTARPPDGDIEIGLRVHSILRDQHLAMNIFTVLGLCAWPWIVNVRRRVWAALSLALVLAAGVLLVSKGFWQQYNTLLAAPQALVASFAPAIAGHKLRHWLVTAATCLFLLMPLHSAFKGGRARAPEQIALIEEIQKLPTDTCIFSFEPAWLIMADRFPSPCEKPPILDTYLVMLMDARKHQETFPSTALAFASDEAQTRVMQSLADAQVIVLGPRGEAQLNQKSKEQLSQSFLEKNRLMLRSR